MIRPVVSWLVASLARGARVKADYWSTLSSTPTNSPDDLFFKDMSAKCFSSSTGILIEYQTYVSNVASGVDSLADSS
jgi:hypothetical protein